MAGKPSPVTPAVVAWAVEQDGRSVDELAVTLKVDPETLRGWMRGDVQPTVGEVSRLAQRLRRPRALFFLPSAPTSSAIPTAFRRPPGSDPGHRVSQPALLAARRAYRVQRAVADAREGYLGPVPLPRADETADRPADVAATVRQWLQVADDQTWGDEYAALNDWRRALDDRGILTFALQLGPDEVRGFARWDELAPLIVVNTVRVPPQVRLYTIGHELAHLVLRDSAACVEPRGDRMLVDSPTERWCEMFAATLLMPAAEVRALMRARCCWWGRIRSQ